MREPLSIVIEAIGALDRGEWRRVADMIDPGELQVWFERYIASVPEEPRRQITPEGVRRNRPDMPEEVAQYYADRINRETEWGSSLGSQFAGVKTRDELRSLESAEALARYLQAQDPRWQFTEHLKRLTPELRAIAQAGTPECRREVVGVVHEGENLAHVVYRVLRHPGGADAAGVEAGELEVASLRRTDDGWWLRLTGELFAPGTSFVFLDADAKSEVSDG